MLKKKKKSKIQWMNEIFREEFYILKRIAVWNLDIFPIQKKGVFFFTDIADRYNIWEVCVVGETFMIIIIISERCQNGFLIILRKMK